MPPMLFVLLKLPNLDPGVLCWPLVLLLPQNTVLYPSLLLLSLLILLCPMNVLAPGYII